MIDEESRLPIETPEDRYSEGLLYDYSKFISTLSLLVLGGVLSLSQAAGASDLPRWKMGFVIGAIAIGGVFAFATANALVDARAGAREPSKRLRLQTKAATAAIAIGLGAFLQMWWTTIR
jgi:hypothetical protein